MERHMLQVKLEYLRFRIDPVEKSIYKRIHDDLVSELLSMETALLLPSLTLLGRPRHCIWNSVIHLLGSISFTGICSKK